MSKQTKSKFKGCFIDERPDYEYDILWEGEKLARAKTLDASDYAAIEKAGMSKEFVVSPEAPGDGKIVSTINSHKMVSEYIFRALKGWELDRPITRQFIDMLSQELRMHIFKEIEKHEQKSIISVEDNEKN